jgi:hypothetical protein
MFTTTASTSSPIFNSGFSSVTVNKSSFLIKPSRLFSNLTNTPKSLISLTVDFMISPFAYCEANLSAGDSPSALIDLVKYFLFLYQF